jgi:predicted glycosyltransferase
MRIWIDLANSPHVPFFRALTDEFTRRGHDIEVTAREFAETVPLARAAGFSPTVIGAHGGRELAGKAGNLFQRAWALRSWASGRSFDLAVSHNSYSQILAARGLGLRSVTLMDYEHQPANHLAFRLASRVIVPRAFPEEQLGRYGANETKVRRYDGIKEDVYLSDFQADSGFRAKLSELGITPEDVIVVVRPPARDALYHRFENELFSALLERLASRQEVAVVFLPRNAEQRATYGARAGGRFTIPEQALDGANLVAASDLVVSAGGTMNREAAALGVPAATIYAGAWAAIDEELVREGRLLRISSLKDLDSLRLEKKSPTPLRGATNVKARVVDLILES